MDTAKSEPKKMIIAKYIFIGICFVQLLLCFIFMFYLPIYLDELLEQYMQQQSNLTRSEQEAIIESKPLLKVICYALIFAGIIFQSVVIIGALRNWHCIIIVYGLICIVSTIGAIPKLGIEINWFELTCICVGALHAAVTCYLAGLMTRYHYKETRAKEPTRVSV